MAKKIAILLPLLLAGMMMGQNTPLKDIELLEPINTFVCNGPMTPCGGCFTDYKKYADAVDKCRKEHPEMYKPEPNVEIRDSRTQFSFPDNPIVGQIWTCEPVGISWKYDGTAWMQLPKPEPVDVPAIKLHPCSEIWRKGRKQTLGERCETPDGTIWINAGKK